MKRPRWSSAVVRPQRPQSEAKEFFRVGDASPVDQISSRIDTGAGHTSSFRAGQNKLAAPLVASLAAVGFGLASMFGNNLGELTQF